MIQQTLRYSQRRYFFQQIYKVPKQKKFRRYFSKFGKRHWETTDFYHVLGVPKTANAKEIKGSYYRFAKKYHPDIVAQDADEKERERKLIVFQKVQEAYEVLGDEKNKMEYDQNRNLKKQQQSGQGFQGDMHGHSNWGDSSDYNPYEFMKTAHQADSDFKKMFEQSKGRRLTREEWRKRKQRTDNYQAHPTSGFGRRQEFNIMAFFNYYLVGTLAMVCIATIGRLLWHANKISQLEEIESNPARYKTELDVAVEREQEKLRIQELRTKKASKLRRAVGGFPPYLTLTDKGSIQMFQILLKENWVNDCPTYRGDAQNNLQGEYLMLWFDSPTKQWRFSLRKHVGSATCYAFVEEDIKNPGNISKPWYVYKSDIRKYVIDQLFGIHELEERAKEQQMATA